MIPSPELSGIAVSNRVAIEVTVLKDPAHAALQLCRDSV